MRKTIPFVKSTVDCPIVKFMLGNGAVGYALVDTGSEITLVDEQFAKKNKGCFDVTVTKEKIVMHGISGSEEKSIIKAMTRVNFEDMDSFLLDALLSDLSHVKTFYKNSGQAIAIDAVIGSRFLTENKAKINFINSKISLEQ